MGRIVSVVSGIGVLIGIFLVVSNGTQSAKIINAIGTNAVSGVKTLQGR